MYITLAQAPFAAAAARAREHAARSGAPLLAGKAVHILRSTEAGSQGGSYAEALTRVALAHGAKVGYLKLNGAASSCHMHGKSCKCLSRVERRSPSATLPLAFLWVPSAMLKGYEPKPASQGQACKDKGANFSDP